MAENSNGTSIYESIRTIANSIADSARQQTLPALPTTSDAISIAPFPSPELLTPRLTDLGLRDEVAERMSGAFMGKAEQLKVTSERIVQIACTKLASLPRCIDSMPLNVLQQQVIELHRQRYKSTLSLWAQQATELAESHLRYSSAESPKPSTRERSEKRSTKSKRQFKSEYLPLFEFAFEKDRFPSREDKKHLARISGMSYRQVCVWFQNRRCRHASRVKSHHITPPPQTFEEMRERLSVSAREALLKPPPSKKDLYSSQDTLPHSSSSTSLESSTAVKREPPATQDPTFRPINILEAEEMASPSSAGRDTSQEASEDGDESDEHDELEDDDYMQDVASQLIPMTSSFTLEPSPITGNPLNPLKTPTATVFPAPYKPSQLTFDPFVVEQQPWLRHPQSQQTRPLINPTQEALDDIMGGFDNMDVVDVVMPDDEGPMKPMAPRNANTGRLEKPLPRRRTPAPSPPRTPSDDYLPAQRTFSSSSFGSSGSWSSDASTPLSRSSSYSTAPSSLLSSPHLSEISLLTPSECAIEVPSDYAPSPLTAPSPSAQYEAVCDLPIDDEVTPAAPFDSSSAKLGAAWEPASKSRVSAWMTDVSTQQEKDAAQSKWEQLLAAVSVATPLN